MENRLNSVKPLNRFRAIPSQTIDIVFIEMLQFNNAYEHNYIGGVETMEKSSRVQVDSKKAGAVPCRICTGTKLRIQGNGLCERCYQKEWAINNKGRRSKFSSRDYDACISCGTTDKFHQGHGLCASCYSNKWMNENRIKTREHAIKHYYKYHEAHKKASLKRNLPLLSIEKKREYGFRKKYNSNGILTLEKYNYSCVFCGFSLYPRVIEIHHIDMNRLNNDLSNLEPLCPTCHKIKHYAARDIVRTYE